MARLAELWGQRLREARIEAGLTQEALAELCGVDQQMISHWERGLGAPRDPTRPRLARALDMSVHDLFVYPEEDDESEPGNGDTEAA